MNKQQALDRLTALEREAAELRKIIEAPEKPAPEQWITNFLNENSKKWRVEVGENWQSWYLGEQKIFEVDLKARIFYCERTLFWNIFHAGYGMEYADILQLITNQILKQFNCEGFTVLIKRDIPCNRY